MESGDGRIARFRHGQYTGENRCLPCTVVNVCIAFGLAVTVQAATFRLDVPALAVPGSAAVLVVGLGAIYLRGYLVPGTPTLTERYFPDWLLAAFGKEHDTTGLVGTGVSEQSVQHEQESVVDVESTLLDGGVLTESEDGTELRLTAEADRSIDEAVTALRTEDGARARLLDVLAVTRGDVAFEEHGAAFRVYCDGTPVGTWESRPAFLADLAGAAVLADRLPEWDDLPVNQRGELLNGLRLYLTTCPACSGPLSFGTDTVESCCTTREVAAVSCDDCGARVYESDPVE